MNWSTTPGAKICVGLLSLCFLGHVLAYMWVLPSPSDPLQYLGSVAWGTTYAYFPWLDRIALANGLAMVGYLLPIPVYYSGPIYVLLAHALTLLVGMSWLNRRGGIGPVLAFGLIYNFSYFFLYRGVQLFPDTTLALYSLLAFVCFEGEQEKKKLGLALPFWAGLFSVLAVFSKATAVFIPIAFLVLSFQKRRQWKPLVAGMVAGTLGSLALFALLYDWPSLVNTFEQFFKSNLQLNLTGRPRYNNMVPYLQLLFWPQFMPVFFFLIACPSAYRSTQIRGALGMAWGFIGILIALYLFSSRGFSPIPTYLYEGYLFASLAFSLHFGPHLERVLSQHHRWKNVAWVFLAVILISIGSWIGRKYSPVDIYEPSKLAIPPIIARFYAGGALIAGLTLCVLEIWRPTRIVVYYFGFLALWCTAYGGGLAAENIKFHQAPEANFYYQNAPIFNEVPENRMDVFAPDWLGRRQGSRLLWVYRLFFDEKFPRATEGHLRQYQNDKVISQNIRFYKKAAEIPEGTGAQILTTQPSKIHKLCPDFTVLKTFQWGDRQFSVMNREGKCIR